MEKHDEKQDCPTCGGQGYMYQIEAQLGGDFFREPPAGCHSQKVTCPRCAGSGTIQKVIVAIIAAAGLWYWIMV